MSKVKENYMKAKAGRLHAEEILEVLESTREKLEESIREVDDRIMDVVKELRDFERLEEKLFKQTISQPWLG